MNTIRYDVYIGSHQKENDLRIDAGVFKNILHDVFSKYEIDFSINKLIGGYIHEDGTYIVEDSFKMTFIGKRSLKEEKEFVDELKSYFKQESILLIKTNVDSILC